MSGPRPPGPPPGPPPAPPSSSSRPAQREVDAADAAQTLRKEQTTFWQEVEIERILSAFKLNPYEVLEVPLEAEPKEITKIYRRKSLLIHPDKVSHLRAVEAFDLLKKASSALLDEAERKKLDEVVMEARITLLRELNLPSDTPSDDPRVAKMGRAFEDQLRVRTQEIMVDDELRRRRAVRLQHAAEGAESKKREETIAERKRKLDSAKDWEDTRDERVDGWRTFVKGGGGKKKKKKTNVLG